MKKNILLLCIASVLLNTYTLACDICGSGAGGGYMGLLPGFKKKFISLRYSHNQLTSHLRPDGNSSYLTSKEKFSIAELWGAVNIGSRFRVAAFIPINFMSRTNSEGTTSQKGSGDVSAIGYYQLLQQQKTTDAGKLLKQSLWIGAGVKLPSGKYNAEERNILTASQNSFQTGTGSTDLSLHLMHDLRLYNFGISTNTSYKKNTFNHYGYRYGDKVTVNMLAYYKLNVGKDLSIAPNAGVLYEMAQKDKKEKDITVFETGGHSFMGTIGTELSFKKWGAGMNFQTVLEQRLGEGKLLAGNRGMIYMSFSF